MTQRTLCHFQLLKFTPVYWESGEAVRQDVKDSLLLGLRGAVPRFDLYSIFPAGGQGDLLLWSSRMIQETGEIADFFACLAKSLNQQRRWLQPLNAMWGLTGASSYSRGQSSQAIDPMSETRKPYFVMYPFVKTVDWYRTSRDTRQGMMNEHIRIGHQYPEITQLLLYSTGIQDQEFIVVYEMDNLVQFSDLVVELRGSEARKYTERDTPIITAFYHSPEQTLEING